MGMDDLIPISIFNFESSYPKKKVKYDILYIQSVCQINPATAKCVPTCIDTYMYVDAIKSRVVYLPSTVTNLLFPSLIFCSISLHFLALFFLFVKENKPLPRYIARLPSVTFLTVSYLCCCWLLAANSILLPSPHGSTHGLSTRLVSDGLRKSIRSESSNHASQIAHRIVHHITSHRVSEETKKKTPL